MIKYDLQCDQDHKFDSWFRSSADFDEQLARGLATCPMCGSGALSKRLMAPGIPSKSNREISPPSQLPVQTAPVAAALTEPQEKMVEMIREFRAAVVENADNVGDKFADEARKMHYGETETRSIYGRASGQDAKDLSEEGIDVHPLPLLPEDRN